MLEYVIATVEGVAPFALNEFRIDYAEHWNFLHVFHHDNLPYAELRLGPILSNLICFSRRSGFLSTFSRYICKLLMLEPHSLDLRHDLLTYRRMSDSAGNGDTGQVDASRNSISALAQFRKVFPCTRADID